MRRLWLIGALLVFVAAPPSGAQQPVIKVGVVVDVTGGASSLGVPERNTVLQSKPELVAAMARAGVKMQVTTGSLTGEFGEEARTAAAQWLRAGFVHFMATDAHNLAKRPPRFRAARQQVVELCGEPVAQALFVDNPRAVVEGRGLPYDPDIPERLEKPGVMERIRGFFGSHS